MRIALLMLSTLVACAGMQETSKPTPPAAPRAMLAAPAKLGTACEASAARVVACPGKAKESCLLVADNERQELLYTAGDPGALPATPALRLAKADGSRVKVDDIEAIEMLGDEIWVVGSHGRKRWMTPEQLAEKKKKDPDADQCDRDKGRSNVFHGRWGTEHEIKGTVMTTDKDTWKQLLRGKCTSDLFALAAGDAAGRTLAAKACAAFELNDDAAKKHQAGCEHGFNIEGAAAIPDAGGKPRLWLGLRAPVIDGGALLLRLVQDSPTFRFDGIATIVLPKHPAIRELAFVEKRLWIVAGPVEDAKGPFTLARVDVATLASGVTLVAREVESLPAGSEGLAIAADGSSAIVVTDGAEKKEPGTGAAPESLCPEKPAAACCTDSTFLRVPLAP